MSRRFLASAVILIGLAGASLAQEAGDPVRGLAVAKKICAECHAVDPNEASPTINGAPSFEDVANTPGMTSTALTVWLQTPHKNMPDFILAQNDKDDVISYIMSLRKPK